MINYNYHLEISELLDDGMSYEEACALCEFVSGVSEHDENEKKRKEPTPSDVRSKLRRKKWLEKTERKTIDRKENGNAKI